MNSCSVSRILDSAALLSPGKIFIPIKGSQVEDHVSLRTTVSVVPMAKLSEGNMAERRIVELIMISKTRHALNDQESHVLGTK